MISSPQAFTASHIWCGPGDMRAGYWVALSEGRLVGVSAGKPQGCQLTDLGDGLLMPGLINAHTHLELSFQRGTISPQGDFLGWLGRLVVGRPGHGKVAAKRAALAAAQEAAGCGTACAGDITNTGRAQALWPRAGISAVSFFEAIGPQRWEPPAEAVVWEYARLQAMAIAAHAPYSVPDWRLRALKARARRLPFCIHCAESQAEMEFFAGGGEQGRRFAEFLSARNLKRDELGISAPGPVEHLANLGVLDANTLLVHCVQISPQDVDIIAKSQASVCVCPRSNLGLTGGLAPVEELLAAGVNLALGTDSLASVTDMSLWSEMAALMRAKPGLAPETVLTMTTLGGARALKLSHAFGRLDPGVCAPLAFAPLAASLGLKQAMEAAVHNELAGEPQGLGGWPPVDPDQAGDGERSNQAPSG